MPSRRAFLSLLAGARSQEPAVLSCVAGLPRCIGVPDVARASEWGCPLIQDTDCSGRSTTKTCGGCIAPRVVDFACLGQGTSNTTSQDGTPVTFSLPVDTRSIKAEHFRYVFADGSTRAASCAIARGQPAGEGNELQTIAIFGDAGGWADFAVGLEVVGDVLLLRPDGSKVSARGLSYRGPSLDVAGGPRLLAARYEVFSTRGETLRNPLIGARAFPNHCQHLFPQTTHRIQLLFNGGVTLDGLHAITPDRLDLVELRDAAGAVLPAGAVLGLADLGSSIPRTQCEKDAYVEDGDNYLDICLRMDADTPLPAQVHLPCGEGARISLPKGLEYPCRPQTVSVQAPVSVLAPELV